MTRLIFLAFGLLVSGAASAQAPICRPPARIATPRPDTGEVRRLPIGSYTLALSWSPQHCATAGRSDPDDAFQCRGGARFGFVLHGLWPDGEGRIWPQYCRPVGIVPAKVVRETICATPSAQLIQHEWAKHGSCMERDPARYFARARRLYDEIRIPELRRVRTVADLTAAFASANPAIPRSAIRVTTDRGGWLDEIWLCLDRNLRFARCERTQDGGVPPGTVLRIRR